VGFKVLDQTFDLANMRLSFDQIKRKMLVQDAQVALFHHEEPVRVLKNSLKAW